MLVGWGGVRVACFLLFLFYPGDILHRFTDRHLVNIRHKVNVCYCTGVKIQVWNKKGKILDNYLSLCLFTGMYGGRRMPADFPASLVPHSLIYYWFRMSGHQAGLLANSGAVPPFPYPPSVYCVVSYRSSELYRKIVSSLVMLQVFKNLPGNYMSHLIYHLNKHILTTQCVYVSCDLQNETLLLSCTGVTYLSLKLRRRVFSMKCGYIFFLCLICLEIVFINIFLHSSETLCVTFSKQSWVHNGTSRAK